MDDRFNILIVDDDPDVLQALRRSLHVPGYTILQADDGKKALAVLRENDIHAIVSDYNMPEMNGLDLLQQVRIAKPDILRILLTARADVHLAVRALNEGAVHRFLLKPWDHFDLRGILRMALHQRGGSSGSEEPAAKATPVPAKAKPVAAAPATAGPQDETQTVETDHADTQRCAVVFD